MKLSKKTGNNNLEGVNMNMLVNRYTRWLFITLVLIFLSAAVISQILTYTNAERLKNKILEHDYYLTGALLESNPGLEDEIRSAFASGKSDEITERGRQLLEQLGYKSTMNADLIPEVDLFRKNGTEGFLVLFCLLTLLVLLSVYLYTAMENKKIERYIGDIQRIMNGDTGTCLDDTEEGVMPRLAAAVNHLTASLNTHIEKEKQNRIFLKDIIANISHQLKTPLSALGMYIEIMREEQTDNEVITSFLGKSQNELERMQSLTANLLKLAKLDAGIIELNKGKHSINEIVDKAAESLKTRIAREGKEFAVKAVNPVGYCCDREWMIEAFSNLIKNAVEHTAQGNRIEVSIEENPLMVKVLFSDNGEGIHSDDLNHIFKRFYRSRFSQNKQGTGIGLTLSKSVVEMHDGYISVESTLKKGTMFTVHLPKLTNQ
jgi:signal transduction histidine kinase